VTLKSIGLKEAKNFQTNKLSQRRREKIADNKGLLLSPLDLHSRAISSGDPCVTKWFSNLQITKPACRQTGLQIVINSPAPLPLPALDPPERSSSSRTLFSLATTPFAFFLAISYFSVVRFAWTGSTSVQTRTRHRSTADQLRFIPQLIRS